MPATSAPPHWPPDLCYIESPKYHSSVPMALRIFIQGKKVFNAAPERQSARLVVIRSITSPSHPAVGQYGLFTSKKIPPRTHLIDYIGEIHWDERESDYDLSLHRTQDGVSIGIDAKKSGNEARFINDFRGICSKPNAVFVERRTASGELRMSVQSGGEAIKKGEEILVSYGKSWWKERQLESTAPQ